MGTIPTDSDAYYTLAFAEHWPGGTYSADYSTDLDNADATPNKTERESE